MQVSTTLTDAQQRVLHIVVKDAAGQIDPTTPATYSSSDTGVVAVGADPNDPAARSCLLTAVKPGQAAVNVSCGAASLSIGVTVLASADTAIDVTFDDATDKAPPAAPATPTP